MQRSLVAYVSIIAPAFSSSDCAIPATKDPDIEKADGTPGERITKWFFEYKP
jgi:hypothetical protein